MNINKLFERVLVLDDYVEQHNFLIAKLAPSLVNELTITNTDTLDEATKKRKKAKKKIKGYGFFYPLYPRVIKTGEQPKDEPTTPPPTDSGDTGGADAGAGEGGSADEAGMVYPYSLGPEHDDEFIQKEALSSTERMRRYNKRHPEKVRKYLKKTQDDRVARNRDRKKAIKKYGKSKMKNHDVHHPNGAKNGNWKLARKDHGRDKKNENIEYVYLSELYEGTVPNGPWKLIVEGGAAGHLAHPYEDDSLTFADIKEMIKRGLVGSLDQEAPVTEKLDGQNLTFSVRDGRVVFARNKGQIKGFGKNALDVAGIRSMFAGRGAIEKSFTSAAEDLQAAVDALPPEQREKMFGEGRKFMNLEVIFPDTKNVIPYDKPVLVFHGTIEYDENGEEVGRDIDDGKVFDQQLQAVNAQKQKTFGLSGPQSISFSDADTARNMEKMKEYGATLARLQQEFDLDDKSTLEDYKKAWWRREIDKMGVNLTDEQKEKLVLRWATGDKKAIGVKDFEDPETKKWFRTFEGEQLADMQKACVRPVEKVFLQVGVDTLRRVTNLLAANNPEAAATLKQELIDAIKAVKETGDRNQLAILQKQIERLDDLGIENIVPSEGIVFMYKGKPYKFTGTFAPVNQILGMMKFSRGKAKEVEEPEQKPAEEPKVATQTTTTPTGEKRTVAIFTGRFQPFHAGHFSIYQALVKKFGKDNVYIATSDVTEPTKSPFGFKEKQQIITRMFDIPEDRVVQVKNPYSPKEILGQLPPDTTYVTAVSQKDSERLAHGKYFKNYDEVPDGERKGYGEQGYYIVAPEMQLQLQGKNISGTQVRALMGNPKITDRAKQEIFTMIYGKFDPDIFKKIVKVTTDSEEALQLTQQHGGEKAAKAKIKDKEPAAKKQPKVKPTPKDPSFYKPGETWETEGGNFGGKNRKNQVRYFGTQERAKKFAQT